MGSYFGNESSENTVLQQGQCSDSKEEDIAQEKKRLVNLFNAGKLIRVLFWMFIPNMIAKLLQSEKVAVEFPKAGLLGIIIELVCCVIICVIFFKLVKVYKNFLVVAIFSIISMLLVAFELFFGESSLYILLMLVIGLIPAIVVTYYEYYGYATILKGIDDRLSMKWIKIMFWQIGLVIVSAVMSIIIVLSSTKSAVSFFLVLALFVLAIDNVILSVVSIIRLVYTYKTSSYISRYVAFEVRKYDYE